MPVHAVPLVLAVALGATAALGLAACTDQQPTFDPPAAATDGARPDASPDAAGVELPDGGLRDLVPDPSQVPDGLVPLLQGSGPRDATAVAGFSADAAAAAGALAANGFTDAYVAQYASPTDARTLTVVVVRFGSADGARADLDADLTASSGEPLDVPTIGDASDVRRVPLPDDAASDLVTVRFRAGATTWLLAWRAPVPADPAVPVDLARQLAERA